MRTLLPAVLLLIAGAQAPTERVVRIGLNQNATTVTLRSDKAFTVQQTATRTAKFTMILSVDANTANRTLSHADLRYRTLVELDGGRLLVLPTTTKVQVQPAGAVIDIDNQALPRKHRGLREFREHVYSRERTAARGLPAGRRPERAQSRRIRSARSAQGAGGGGAHLHPAQHGAGTGRRDTISARPTPARCTLARAHRDSLATQAVMETRGVVATFEGQADQRAL